MTAHVAHGLKIASNTVNVPEGMLSKAVRWLKNYQERQTALLEKETNTGNWNNCRTALKRRKPSASWGITA